VPRRLITAVAGALVALACAAPAHAASVWIEPEHHYLVVVGGPARDELTVSAGTTAGSLTLAARAGGPLGPAPAGCAPAGPQSITCAGPLAGVYVDGSGGNDSLTLTAVTASLGGDGDDVLHGGPGGDFLGGGEGNDTVDPGAGVDTARGDDGADLLRARDNSADHLACGSGADRVEADAVDQPATDCETITRPPLPAQPAPTPAPPDPGPIAPVQIPTSLPALAPVRIASRPVTMSRAGVVGLTLHCPATEKHACQGRVTLRLRGGAQASAAGGAPVLGRAKFPARPGGKVHVRVKLSRNGRRRIIRRKRARCSVVARIGNRMRSQSIVVRAR
jgi:RTX calcium-binding nonapeptide repeat (4 copies)